MFQNYSVYDKTLFTMFAETVKKVMNDNEAFDSMIRAMHPINGKVKHRNFELLEVLDFHYAQSPDEAPVFGEKLIEMTICDLIDNDPDLLKHHSIKKPLLRGVYPHLFPTSDKHQNCAALYSKLLSLITGLVESSRFDSEIYGALIKVTRILEAESNFAPGVLENAVATI